MSVAACLQFSWEGRDRIFTASCLATLAVRASYMFSLELRPRWIWWEETEEDTQLNLWPSQTGTCTYSNMHNPSIFENSRTHTTDRHLKEKKSEHKYKMQKSLQWFVPTPSKRKRAIKPKLTKQTHIPKSKQQQNPAGSGVSAKCDMMKLEQGHKSPRFRNHTATAASCWNSFGACSLQYGYTFI